MTLEELKVMAKLNGLNYYVEPMILFSSRFREICGEAGADHNTEVLSVGVEYWNVIFVMLGGHAHIIMYAEYAESIKQAIATYPFLAELPIQYINDDD